MQEIFVSYSSKDRVYVDSFLLEAKESKDLKFWVSHKGISTGEDFKKEIDNQIKKASSAVIFVSKNSLSSDFINNVELPKLFEKHNTVKEFNIFIILIDDCSYDENKYLVNRQFVNSPSTSIKNLSSSQINIVYKDLFLNLTKTTKKKKNNFLKIASLLMPLIFGFLYFLNTSISSTQIENSEISENTGLPVEPIVNDDRKCFNSQIFEVYKENSLYNVSTNHSQLLEDCNNSISTFLYFSELLSINPDELSESLINQIDDESVTKCADNFKIEYGYSSNETLYDFIYLFTNNSQNEIELYCLLVLKELNSGELSQSKFNADFAYLDIEEYRSDRGISKRSMDTLIVGDCFNHMDNFYGSENMLEDPKLSNAVYKISCDYPHNIEFFEEFFYTKSINETTDDIDDYADELCGTAFNVKFSTLEEIKSKRTEAGWPYNDVYFTYNIQKAEDNEEFRILCLLGFSSEIIDIKTDFSIVDLFNKKIFKLNPNNEEFIEIASCNLTPLKAGLPDGPVYYPSDIEFRWSTPSADIEYIEFYFEDYDFYLSYIYEPTSKDLEFIQNWSAIFTIAFFANENNDEAIVRINVVQTNGEVLSDECTYKLDFQNN